MSTNGNRRPSSHAGTATRSSKAYSQGKRSWFASDLVAVLLLQNSLILLATVVAMLAVAR